MMPTPGVPTMNVVDRARIELAATALQVQHSTPELPAHAFFQGPHYCIYFRGRLRFQDQPEKKRVRNKEQG